MTSQKDPCSFIYSCTRPLGGNRNRGAHGEPDSRDGAHQRGGERGGGVLSTVDRGPAAVVGAHGGAPVMESERDQTGKF